MSLGSKFNLKPHMTVAVLGAPPGLTLDLGEDVALTTEPGADALILFVANRADLTANQHPVIEGAATDRVAWVAYPKGGQLGSDLNRDILWELLASAGIRPVRQISIDETWSALRFRPA